VNLRLHGDTIARPGLLDFAVNVWPGERPAALEEALVRGLASGGRYPDERAARAAIGRRHSRDDNEVLLTNGACEAFWLLAHALRPTRAAVIHPGFTEPEAALRSCGSEIARVFREPERWRFALDDVPDDADCVVIANPNNPTGTLTPPATIAGLARPGRLLVLDESFIDFAAAEGLSFAGDRVTTGLIVVRSLTKLWSLPGIRAGYLLADSAIVERLAASRQPWSVNSVACTALEMCACDNETPTRVAREVAAARTELEAALGGLPGVCVWPSAANFLLLRVEDPRVVDALSGHGISVRPAASFPGLDEHHIRVAVRTREDHAALVSALREILG
jgi:histidinol-phosphate/aromatic aminotransferase/cobyric acid decarboxylase-like protein